MKRIMMHIVGGYPTMRNCEKNANLMIDRGAALLEIQIPFSDPVADGPVIMKANHVALENGTTPEDCFELMKRLKKRSSIPMLFMTYFNIALRYGLEKFCKRAKEVGSYGLIIPDMPIDEEKQEHYLKFCKHYKLHAIQIISPMTPDRRLKRIAKVASGFVYCVARTGTTGTSKKISRALGHYLNTVKKYISIPLAIGFGISGKTDVEEALKQADIAVIGSKIMTLLDTGNEGEIRKFLSSLSL